jgi:hypothetical protein
MAMSVSSSGELCGGHVSHWYLEQSVKAWVSNNFLLIATWHEY